MLKCFFCLLLVGVCIDEYVTNRSYVLYDYTLATEENVCNVRVCA